jgi:hypothetical protein
LVYAFDLSQVDAWHTDTSDTTRRQFRKIPHEEFSGYFLELVSSGVAGVDHTALSAGPG